MTNTLTKPRYQGRTYDATLTDGRKVAITVPRGYGPDGGEVARLHDAAIARYGTTVAGCRIVELGTVPASLPRLRWWAVELRREFTEGVLLPDGSYDCYGSYETDYVLVEAHCWAGIYQDEAVKKALADGWQITEIAPSSGPAPWRDECPF